MDPNQGKPYPDWVNLGSFLRRPAAGHHYDRRLASGTTSNGDHVDLTFRAVAPPGTSRLFFHWVRARGAHGTWCSDSDAKALAAHRNSLLLSFAVRRPDSYRDITKELFVLQAPSVHLTRIRSPPHGMFLRDDMLGIMCREDDDNGEFVVAHLAVNARCPSIDRRCPVINAVMSRRGGGPGPLTDPHWSVTAELSLLLSQEASWRAARTLPIHHPNGRGKELVWWRTDAVVTFGNTICWVDYLRGILFCDVLSPDPSLQYLPLPVNPFKGDTDPCDGGRGPLDAHRNLCVTGDGGALKFVDVAGHCWFTGRPDYSSKPWAIRTWTLTSDRLAWVRDGDVKCDEFFALTEHHLGFPYPMLQSPVVDMGDPETIFVALREEPGSDEPKRRLIVAVDMPSKTLTMQVPSTYMLGGELDSCYDGDPRIACQFSRYLNSAVPNNGRMHA